MKITHSALAQPPMSWLRKMSMNTMISSQIQMMKRKKYKHGQEGIEHRIAGSKHRESPCRWSLVGEYPARATPCLARMP